MSHRLDVLDALFQTFSQCRWLLHVSGIIRYVVPRPMLNWMHLLLSYYVWYKLYPLIRYIHSKWFWSISHPVVFWHSYHQSYVPKYSTRKSINYIGSQYKTERQHSIWYVHINTYKATPVMTSITFSSYNSYATKSKLSVTKHHKSVYRQHIKSHSLTYC